VKICVRNAGRSVNGGRGDGGTRRRGDEGMGGRRVETAMAAPYDGRPVRRRQTLRVRPAYPLSSLATLHAVAVSQEERAGVRRSRKRVVAIGIKRLGTVDRFVAVTRKKLRLHEPRTRVMTVVGCALFFVLCFPGKESMAKPRPTHPHRTKHKKQSPLPKQYTMTHLTRHTVGAVRHRQKPIVSPGSFEVLNLVWPTSAR